MMGIGEKVVVVNGVAEVGVARFDATGRCVFANDRLCEILGWSPEQAGGRRWRRELSPELEARLGECWRELRAGRPVVTNHSFERPGGCRVSIQLELMPERDGHGRVTSVLATCVDLMAPGVDVDAAARERPGELESIYRNAPVGLAFVDRELRYLRVNQMIADMNGVAIEEMVGRSYRDLSPETADVAEPFLRGVMESGESIRNLEVRSRPPSDPEREHVYLLSMYPVRNTRGEVIGHVSAVQDVTELRRAEGAAARRLEELEILYANTPVGLCYMDTDLRIVHLNPRFAQLGEASLEEQIGRTAPEVIPETLAGQIIPQLRYVARTGIASAGLEVRGFVPGLRDREFIWLVHTHPVSSSNGEANGIITVLQDVTMFAERRDEIEAVRDRLTEAQRVARLGSWEWSLAEDRFWWSPELYGIFGEGPGYKPSYVGFFEHVHPADRQKVRRQLERAMEDDSPYRMTFRILRPDGSERVLFTAARVERTAAGIAARVVGTCQDVTEFGPPEAGEEGDSKSILVKWRSGVRPAIRG